MHIVLDLGLISCIVYQLWFGCSMKGVKLWEENTADPSMPWFCYEWHMIVTWKLQNASHICYCILLFSRRSLISQWLLWKQINWMSEAFKTDIVEPQAKILRKWLLTQKFVIACGGGGRERERERTYQPINYMPAKCKVVEGQHWRLHWAGSFAFQHFLHNDKLFGRSARCWGTTENDYLTQI